VRPLEGGARLLGAELAGPREDESASWLGKLSLTFGHRRGGTRLLGAPHEGPLRVQRPFYPEGEHGSCHVYILHPPGGVVAGDRLQLDLTLGHHTSALLTAPGASKLYRARTSVEQVTAARIAQRFAVDDDALLEWLPHETIAFSGARASVVTAVDLTVSASYVGWDILCLGRPAAGERFASGELRTELSVSRAGKLQFFERGLYRGGDALLDEAWGLAGKPVWATLIVASPKLTPDWLSALRAGLTQEGGTYAATIVSGVLLLRYLGHSTREARQLFEQALGVLRPLYAGRAAVPPRIWST
jgi:urease accessory protein